MSSAFQQRFSNKSPLKQVKSPGDPLHEAQSVIDPKYPGSRQEFEQKQAQGQKDFISSLPKWDGPTQTGAINEFNGHVLVGGGGAKAGINLSKKIPSFLSKQVKKAKALAVTFGDNIATTLLSNNNTNKRNKNK
tara:strand:- start:38 stop:439 length:402 start_codon:yes stop_codon:yes gene_type:complete